MNRIATKLALAGLITLLLRPGLALTSFFAISAMVAAPAAVPRTVDVVVVLGGDGGVNGRYTLGRDMVLAGYSKRLILVYPSPARVMDAQTKVLDLEIVASTQGPGSWGEAIEVRERMQARGLRTAIVVSDPPHMLRLRYTWGSVLPLTEN